MNELIVKSQDGDKEAFTELVMIIEKDLYRIARARLNNEFDIDEAIQETMIKAFKSIKKLKNINYFKTWIIKILINTCNTIYKSKKENITVDLENIKNANENQFESFENQMDFEILLKDLNYDEKIAVTLYYAEKFTTKEIAKILKTREGTIKSRISRSKEKIRNSKKEDFKIG